MNRNDTVKSQKRTNGLIRSPLLKQENPMTSNPTPQPTPERAQPMTAIELIQAERRNVVCGEGPNGENEYDGGFLSAAASAYALLACDLLDIDFRAEDFSKRAKERLEKAWPWNEEEWEPSPDPIRNLAKAGALIAAEIDRLQCLSNVASPLSESGARIPAEQTELDGLRNLYRLLRSDFNELVDELTEKGYVDEP